MSFILLKFLWTLRIYLNFSWILTQPYFLIVKYFVQPMNLYFYHHASNIITYIVLAAGPYFCIVSLHYINKKVQKHSKPPTTRLLFYRIFIWFFTNVPNMIWSDTRGQSNLIWYKVIENKRIGYQLRFFYQLWIRYPIHHWIYFMI
jgi:hypothetical protein